jgi:hypothetical protein
MTGRRPSNEGGGRMVELTQGQIAFLRLALDYAQRAIDDTSYDPQVQEWARTHGTDTAATIAALREALAD